MHIRENHKTMAMRLERQVEKGGNLHSLPILDSSHYNSNGKTGLNFLEVLFLFPLHRSPLAPAAAAL